MGDLIPCPSCNTARSDEFEWPNPWECPVCGATIKEHTGYATLTVPGDERSFFVITDWFDLHMAFRQYMKKQESET
jgi:hypothetical protein